MARVARAGRSCHDFRVSSEPDIDVFEYRDYRVFLRDSYEYRKKSEYGFSYRAFAKRAGLGGPNYLKLVTEGERNLTSEMAGRFAEALGLRGEAASYFCDLVLFNQAASASERERSYRRLQGYRRYRAAFRLDAAHAAYHARKHGVKERLPPLTTAPRAGTALRAAGRGPAQAMA